MTTGNTLANLVWMSRVLGEPERDYVIQAEGNSSARVDDRSFWVKASGVSLRGIKRRGFVQVRTAAILSLLEDDSMPDAELDMALRDAMTSRKGEARPSVEAAFHAVALTLGQAAYVGHTHPTAVNCILCSQGAKAAMEGRLFPEEVVVCGPASAYVPYADPGLPLAREIRRALMIHLSDHGHAPKVVLLENHGLIALGRSAHEVLQITEMCVKVARVLLGTLSLGGPRFLADAAVSRIASRPDELYRKRRAESKAGLEA